MLKGNMINNTAVKCAAYFNMLGLFAINMILFAGFYWQIAYGELPCPLCLLQRLGLILIGIALTMNLTYGIKGRHYSLAIIGALTLATISGRQMLLHILPGDTGYGSAVFGLHLYTVCFIIAALAIVSFAALIALPVNSYENNLPGYKYLNNRSLVLGIVFFFFILVALNFVSTLAECGFSYCESDPVKYKLLSYNLLENLYNS